MSNNNPGTKERKLDRQYLEKYSDEQKQMLEAVSREVAYYDANAVDMIAKSMKWADENAKGESSQIDAMNKVYACGLLEQAARPILQGGGRNPEAVWSSVGIMIGGYLTNPEFRKMVDKGVSKALYPSVKARSDAAGPDSKWRKWCDKIEMNMNGGHLPLTPKSAAMMKLGLDRKYYREMRLPGADSADLMEKYNTSIENLYQVAEQDGVSRDSLNKNVRTLVGQMQNVDSSVARVYSETAFGDVCKSQGVYDKDMKSFLWAGEYEKKSGEIYADAFTVRPPTNQFQWASTLDHSMKYAFGRCHTAEDVIALGNVAKGGKAPKGKEWMDGWQKRNERDFDIMQDDCRSDSDRALLDRYTSDISQSHFRDWMQAHPKEADKFMKYWQAKERGAQSGPSQSSAKGPVVVALERKLDVPAEIMGDNPDQPDPTYRNF